MSDRTSPRDPKPSHAAVARVRLSGAFAAAALASTLAACVSATGDFGRAAPDEARHAYFYQDRNRTLTAAEEAALEPFVEFGLIEDARLILTDEEREMQNRVWRFIVAPHARQWMFDRDFRPQFQQVHLLMTEDFEPQDYFDYLKRQDYRSSTVRFRTVADHIEADISTLPATFEAICAVEDLDDRRRIAIAEIAPGDADFAARLRVREGENRDFIDWFVRGLQARDEAYALALDNLLIESPHAEARMVNDGLNRLSPFVALAQRGEFCADAMLGPDPSMGFGHALAGRQLMGGNESGEILK